MQAKACIRIPLQDQVGLSLFNYQDDAGPINIRY